MLSLKFCLQILEDMDSGVYLVHQYLLEYERLPATYDSLLFVFVLFIFILDIYFQIW